jgi:CxxC motif-containing protein (DUF1111 family)
VQDIETDLLTRCHTGIASRQRIDWPAVNAALANVTYHPYGDFLLHDMGSLGDGVNDDPSIPHDERLMRTMPLWGIRARQIFLHDG